MEPTSLPLTPDDSYWDGLTNTIATLQSAHARAGETDSYVHGWVHDLGATVTAVLRPRAELQECHVEAAPPNPTLLAPSR